MNRSVRNGLAIAGMAGGIFFLGQAVASADQTASAGNNVDQGAASSSSEGSGSGAGNANFSSAEATNVQKTEVDTDVEGGDGGANIAVINTGVVGGGGNMASTSSSNEQGQQFTKIEFNSGDVVLHQSADGGDVNGSGNVHVSGDNGDQTATATNNVDQTAVSKDEGEESYGSEAGNINKSSAEATNIDITDIETDVEGGDGGFNYAEINTGIIGNTFYCYEGSKCVYDFHTGDVKVVQSADGGDVNNSGNVNVGDTYGHPHADHHKPGHHDADCACHKPAVAPAAPVHHRPAHRAAPVNAYAQPKGSLAYTGAETTAPLALGLIALGAGGALTLAGRRRSSTAAA
ncbi:hypothetical protein ACI78T_07760 [Blastococcus sp. SYSU D00922]